MSWLESPWGAPAPWADALMARVHAAFVGCKVSQADSENVLAALVAAGHDPAADVGDAELHVVLTCGVTGEAERKSRQLVRRLAAAGQPVLVAGCAATLRPGQFSADTVEVVVADGNDERLAALVARATAVAEAPSLATGPAATAARTGAGSIAPGPARSRRTRFTLKVQDGCTARCTYCAVRLARGRPWSLAPDEAVAAAAGAVAAGCGEIVLSGVNLGGYAGSAEDSLAGLVLRLAALPGLGRLRLSSIEPGHLTPALLEALAHARVARHLHVPLQSADDEVLAAMGRPYDFAGYVDAIERARERLSGLAVSTDVIVGFPAESDEAFGRTLAAIDPGAGLFTRAHVFSYSPRPGTEAAALDRLPAAAVKQRRRAALDRAAAAQRAAARDWLARPAEVLIEEYRDGLWRGYSSQYVRYYLAGEAEPGRLVAAVADEPYRDGVRGRVT